MKNIKRSLMAIIALLLATTIFLLTSCTYIIADVSDKISSETDEVDTTHSLVASSNSYGNYVLSKNIESSSEDYNLYKSDEADIYAFIVSCIAFDISNLGFKDIFQGIAVDSLGNTYTGIIFVDGEMTYDADGIEMKTAGFVQLVDDKTDLLLTTSTVENGVVGVIDDDNYYLIDKYVQLNAFSGIVDDYYFSYRQLSPYTLSVSAEEITKTTKYDHAIDLYDFDNECTKWKADPSKRPSLEAYALYSDEAKAYQSMYDALTQLIELQEANHYQSQRSVLMLIDPAVLNALQLGDCPELINQFSVDAISKLEIAEDQFVMITLDGVQIITVPNVEELSQQRVSSGLMQIFTGALMVLGSVIVTVCTFGAGAPLIVAAASIVLGTAATIYALGNIMEGIDNVRLGSIQDIYTEAHNPVKEKFVNAFGEDGETIYHAIGISAMFLQSCLIPINAGLNLATAVGAGVGQTSLILLRVTAVYLLETAVTIGVSTGISLLTSYLVEEWTGNEMAAEWSGLIAGLVSGILTANGLGALDKRFNLSGLHTKSDVLKEMRFKNQKKAINKLNPEKWDSLDEIAQKKAIQELAKQIGKEIGIEEMPKIKYYYSDENEYGFFKDSDYSININTKYIGDTVELVDTIAHEMQHCLQFQLLNKGVINDVTMSYLHYITYDESPALYYSQACERDAFAVGGAWRQLAQSIWYL